MQGHALTVEHGWVQMQKQLWTFIYCVDLHMSANLADKISSNIGVEGVQRLISNIIRTCVTTIYNLYDPKPIRCTQPETRIRPDNFKFYIELLKQKLMNQELIISGHFQTRRGREQFGSDIRRIYKKLSLQMWKALIVTLLDLPHATIHNVTMRGSYISAISMKYRWGTEKHCIVLGLEYINQTKLVTIRNT